MHGAICSLPRVKDVAIGIVMMLLSLGLAFLSGKPYIQPAAPYLPAINFGWWLDLPQVQAALRFNVQFLIGAGLAVTHWWIFRATRVGLILRVVGDSTDAARTMGRRPALIRTLSSAAGLAFAGVGGAYLSRS